MVSPTAGSTTVSMLTRNVSTSSLSAPNKPMLRSSAGLSVAEVVRSIQAQNLAAPVGRITGAVDERTIRLEGRLTRPSDFETLVVATRAGRVIRLGDLADARDSVEEARSAALFNGSPAIGMDILKTKGNSTSTVADDIKQEVELIRAALPPGVSLDVVVDAGERVEASVKNVEEMLIEGAFLTILVVFLFLNSWRSTVITGLALPISVLSAFIAVWAFGFTLNTMSLLGLSLAIGILIDDAIVVRENIVRHVELGADHMRAAHEGTDEIGLAVAATTFSIVCVFVPVGFMPGVAGQWFKPFALTIASAGHRWTSRPFQRIRPADGRTRPEIARSVVDLPLPLAPSSVTISPSPTVSDTPSSARR